MTEREVTPQLPTSGQIIGAVVSKLGIKHPKLQSRTARRYFSADPEQLVKDSSRSEIIQAIAETLVDSGFVSSPQTKGMNYGTEPALAAMLEWHAENWDLLRSFLSRRTMPVLPSHLPKVWEAYVRLAVVDLAIRIAARLHLAGVSPVALVLLDPVTVKARGDYLNRKRRQAGISLEYLAGAVGVTDNAVDAWMYQGARPSDDNIKKIAEALADKIEGSNAVSIARELRALYWVSDVADMLAERIGVEAVNDAIGRLRRYAEAAYHIIDDQFPAADREETLTVLADLGANARVAESVLGALIEREPDEEWRADLRGAGMAWIHRVLSVNLGVHLAEVDDRIQKTEGRLLEDWDVSNPDAYAHYRRSYELSTEGKWREAMAEVEIAARLDPLDPTNHFSLGSAKTGIGIASGDIALVNKGLDALWLAVALDPNWIVPWTEIGLTLLHTDRPTEALKHLRGVKPECGPLDSRYYSALGKTYWKVGQLSEALAAFEAALELDPEEVSNLLPASELALLTGDNEKHRRYLRRAQHFGADEGTLKFWELLREFGQNCRGNGDADEHDREIAVMDAVIRLSPDDDYALMRRGRAHFAKGDDDAAIADLDAVLWLTPDNGHAYLFRGILHGYSKRWERVVADMTEAIRLMPDAADAHYQRGMAYGERDELDEAMADLCEAIRLGPDHADAYRVRGDCLRYKGEYDKAIADFDTALRLDPDNALAHLGRGAAYRMKGEFSKAIADYDVTLRLDPKNLFANRFRGDAYVAKGDYDLAIADCNSALKINPDDPLAYFTRGNAHLFSWQLEQALADFEMAVTLDPTSGRFIYGRGLVRELMDDQDGAVEDYQQARELGYDDSE